MMVVVPETLRYERNQTSYFSLPSVHGRIHHECYKTLRGVDTGGGAVMFRGSGNGKYLDNA